MVPNFSLIASKARFMLSSSETLAWKLAAIPPSASICETSSLANLDDLAKSATGYCFANRLATAAPVPAPVVGQTCKPKTVEMLGICSSLPTPAIIANGC